MGIAIIYLGGLVLAIATGVFGLARDPRVPR